MGHLRDALLPETPLSDEELEAAALLAFRNAGRKPHGKEPDVCDKCGEPFTDTRVHVSEREENQTAHWEAYWCQSCAQERFASLIAKTVRPEA